MDLLALYPNAGLVRQYTDGGFVYPRCRRDCFAPGGGGNGARKARG
jgi:hypothetical protein